jgi:hypothetical protein
MHLICFAAKVACYAGVFYLPDSRLRGNDDAESMAELGKS